MNVLTCRTCKEDKPEEMFNRNSRGYRRNLDCKKCVNRKKVDDVARKKALLRNSYVLKSQRDLY